MIGWQVDDKLDGFTSVATRRVRHRERAGPPTIVKSLLESFRRELRDPTAISFIQGNWLSRRDEGILALSDVAGHTSITEACGYCGTRTSAVRRLRRASALLTPYRKWRASGRKCGQLCEISWRDRSSSNSAVAEPPEADTRNKGPQARGVNTMIPSRLHVPPQGSGASPSA